MSLTTIQIEKTLVDKVVEIAKNKWPIRKIKSNATAIREVFYLFIEENPVSKEKKTKN